MNNETSYLHTGGCGCAKTVNNEFKKYDGKEALLVLGMLGSGKTTLLQELLPYYKKQGKNIQLIVNDIGSLNIDEGRLGSFDPIALTSGCICCEDLASLQDVLVKLSKKESNNDIFIIEPTGIATGEDIVFMIESLGIKNKVITLVNTNTYLTTSQTQKNIINTQLQLADIIGLTHLHEINDLTKTDVFSDLQKRYQNTKMIEIPYSQIIENITRNENNNNLISDITDHLSQLDSTKKTQQSHNHNHHVHNHFPVLSIETIPGDFTVNHLKYMINQIGNNLIRAKGILFSRQFDFVEGGKIIWGDFVNKTTSNRMNIITKTALDYNPITMCLECNEIENNNHSNQMFIPTHWNLSDKEMNHSIKNLLDQYIVYGHLESEKATLITQLTNKYDAQLTDQITKIEIQMNELGESMKYNNPIIRLEYKRLAYANQGEKKVTTIAELRKHCEKPTYICSKRFDFLNSYLIKKYKINLLDDKSIDSSTSLYEFVTQKDEIKQLCQNKEFMQERLSYEYFSFDGGTNKWENYIQ